MLSEVEKALKALLARIESETTSEATMKLTQSALNLVHVWATLKNPQ